MLECLYLTEAQAGGEVTAMSTNIDNPQPLGELNEPKNTTQMSITTEIDVNVGSMMSNVNEESAVSDSHIPVDVLLSSETEKSSKEDPDFDKRTVLVEGKPLQDKIKFVIFEEAILAVFSVNAYSVVQNASLLLKINFAHVSKFAARVEQTMNTISSGLLVRACQKMGHSILLGSAILGTGMIPNLKQCELSNILKYYTILAVHNVWNAEQSARLQEAKEEPIVIASDMRFNSPGHSGLFRLGSTLDMARNVILDTQVIKVNFIALKHDICKCDTLSKLLHYHVSTHKKNLKSGLTFF